MRRSAHQRAVRDLVLLRGAQDLADSHSARAGRSRGRKNRPVHQGDRESDRLDDAVAVVRRHARAAALRRAAAIAPGAGHHRARPTRCHRPRAATRLAPSHGRGRKPDRLLPRAEIRRCACPQGLLRPGLFPARVRAVYDGRARRNPARCRGERRRGQPETDLGRGLADQGRRARPGLCGRRPGPAHRPPGHQPGAAQHRSCTPGPGPGGARPRRRRSARSGASGAGPAEPARADRLCAGRAARLAGVRRVAGGRGLCAALCLGRALGRAARGRADLRVPCRHVSRAKDGRADPGVARRGGADRRRRSFPAYLDQDRRRARGLGRSVQRHGRTAAGILRGFGAEGRGPHPGADGIVGAADRNLRGAARDLKFADRATARA